MNEYKLKIREWLEKEIIITAADANSCFDQINDHQKILSIEITNRNEINLNERRNE